MTAREPAHERPEKPGPRTQAIDVDARATQLGEGSAECSDRIARLNLVLASMDLTTLDPRDTPETVRDLCARARNPLGDMRAGTCAAVCVHAQFVPVARTSLAGSGVRIACVAGDFPAGTASRSVKLDEIRRAAELGADEIDVVFDRRPLVAGEHDRVFDEISAMKEAASTALLKVILETGALGSYDLVREASDIAVRAGADFLKTSTGKLAVGATPGAALVMLESIREFHRTTGRRVGLKVAGGVRTRDDALRYLALVEAILGADGLTPRSFRVGASALLDDLALELA